MSGAMAAQKVEGQDSGEQVVEARVSPVLDVRGLAKRFVLHGIGGRVVEGFSGVDLTVGPGELVALAGRSGAGKSSVIKCVYRTYRPSAGTMWFTPSAGQPVDLATLSDQEVADLREREIGYVSQFLRAEPRRGVLDVVARAGVRRGMAADAAREAAADVLARLRLDRELWQTYPTLLSGGEQQRVNLASALLAPPRLLLLDEPVSALDPGNRDAVLTMVESLVAGGTAVLTILHDHAAIRRLANRVVLMADGRVVAAGEPGAVLTEAA
jgi:alpha-D-ribose 1-methylphosphonate 5-triphosphate synthase subunit PhnL